jgi:hypothetical protein
MITWRIDAQAAAGNEDDAAKPVWSDEVPFCDGACPHYDGKRCRVMGLRPDNICEPVVAEMAKMLSAGPVKP